MKNILIHGLGQNNESWHDVKSDLNKNNIDVECIHLYKMNDAEMTYQNLYNAFCEYCHKQEGKLNLCGLSLGGILALEYAKEYPEKVNSIIIIGIPYKIPKTLMKIQSIVFRFMPKKNFEKMGIMKNEFCCLVHSMSHIKISENLNNVKCQTMILCGSKDRANLNSSKLLNQNIKGSYLRFVSHSSHEVNVDNPQELSHIIYDFWRKDIIEKTDKEVTK